MEFLEKLRKITRGMIYHFVFRHLYKTNFLSNFNYVRLR